MTGIFSMNAIILMLILCMFSLPLSVRLLYLL